MKKLYFNNKMLSLWLHEGYNYWRIDMYIWLHWWYEMILDFSVDVMFKLNFKVNVDSLTSTSAPIDIFFFKEIDYQRSIF